MSRRTAKIIGLATAIQSIEPALDAPPGHAPTAGSPFAGARAVAASGTAAIAAPAASLGAAVRRTRWWVEVLTIVWLCWVYDAVTNLAPLRLGAALGHGRDILSAEQSLGIAPEHSFDRWLAARHTLGVVASYYYDNAHFIVTLGLLGYLWWRRADIYRPLRNSLVLINVVGFLVFWRYPVAPPRMLGGFTDVVASSHALGSWHTGALASEANQLAAMPSLHIAWAVWCSVAVWRITARPLWRVLAVVYPFVTLVAVLATGNHYLLDAVAGALLTAVVTAAVSAAPRARDWLRTRPAAGRVAAG